MQFSAVLSNSTSLLDEASSISSSFPKLPAGMVDLVSLRLDSNQEASPETQKKRRVAGNPDPDAEVIALSPETLLATNRFICEVCNKGFQRDQNLQLHRRRHQLPWKLKQKEGESSRGKKKKKKKVYVCPETTCIHHHPSRALGDLTGIKKHYSRKHGEKKWKCERCSKVYAVYSDWKAHSKACGAREYRCHCGTIFSRKDSFITHRAFCAALAEETARIYPLQPPIISTSHLFYSKISLSHPSFPLFSSHNHHFPAIQNPNPNPNPQLSHCISYQETSPMASPLSSSLHLLNRGYQPSSAVDTGDGFTRDFLGLTAGGSSNGDVREMQLPCSAWKRCQGFGCGDTNWGNC